MAIRNDNDQLLHDLKVAINNLKIDVTSSVGDVTVNTGQLEALLGDSGVRSKNGAGLYPVGRAVGGTDAEGDAPTVHPVLTSGRYDQHGRTLADGKAGEIARSSTGHVLTTSTVTGTVTANLSTIDNAVLDTIDAVLDTIKVDTEAIETASEAILAKNTEIEISANALVAANHTDLLAIEASADALIAANHTDLVALEATLTEIATDGNNIQTLLSTLDGVQDSALTKLGEIEITNNANQVLLGTIDADTNDIKTSVQLLDNVVDGNYLNTNLNIAGADVAGNSGDKSAATQRVVIATDDIPTALINTNLVAIEASADALIAANHSDLVGLATRLNNIEAGVDELIAANHTDLVAIDAVLDTIDADTGAIKTAVEIIDNAINGNEMQVDVVAALPAGNNNIGNVDIASIAAGSNTIGTVNLSAVDNAVLDTIDAVLDTIKVDTEAIETAVEAIEVSQDKLISPTSTVYISGTKAFTGPFYAVTALTDTVIDVSEGNTNILESDDSGSMQATATNITLPAGITINGNFAVIELDSGTAIGYAGAGITVAVAGS